MFLDQVERPSNAWPVSADGSLLKRAGEEEVTQHGPKGGFCAPKSFAIGSLGPKAISKRKKGWLLFLVLD